MAVAAGQRRGSHRAPPVLPLPSASIPCAAPSTEPHMHRRGRCHHHDHHHLQLHLHLPGSWKHASQDNTTLTNNATSQLDGTYHHATDTGTTEEETAHHHTLCSTTQLRPATPATPPTRTRTRTRMTSLSLCHTTHGRQSPRGYRLSLRLSDSDCQTHTLRRLALSSQLSVDSRQSISNQSTPSKSKNLTIDS